MPQRKKIVFWVLLLAVLAIGILATTRTTRPNEAAPEVTTNVYSNVLYGISFQYPKGYVLQEGERGNGERRQHEITLIRQEDAIPPENGEGPTAITIDIYQNDLDKQTLWGWVRGTNDSNFKLSHGAVASTTVGGEEAIQYHWSGLYEAETTAFLHGASIIAVSVTYLTPEDEIIGVYRALLRSLELTPMDN